MKKFSFVMISLLVMMSVSSCEDKDKDNNDENTGAKAVSISNFKFSPASLTIEVGTTVTWTNDDSAAHTVTDEGGAFDSGNMNKGGTFEFTFSTAGTYNYKCDYHSAMTGTIIVQ